MTDQPPERPARLSRSSANPDVCIVGINFAPETTGIAPYTTALARALRSDGLVTSVITGIPHYPQWRVQDERYAVGRRWRESFEDVPIVRVRHHVPPDAGLLGRARMEASFTAGALAVLRRTSPRAVIAVTPSLAAPLAVQLSRTTARTAVLVQDLTGRGAQESGTTGSLPARAIGTAELALLRRAALVGVITPRFGELLIEQGVDPDRIVQLPNFTHIAASSLSIVDARRAIGWPTDATVILHTGNMGRKQGLEVVVAAAREAAARGLPHLYVLTGDGNQRAALEELAAGVPTVRVMPPVTSENYPTALAAADFLLLSEAPGVREMSLPSKLTSYVAARRPVVAAVEPGGITGQLLDDAGAAALVPAGAGEQVVAAVEGLRNDPGRGEALVERASVLGRALWSQDQATARYRSFASRLLEG